MSKITELKAKINASLQVLFLKIPFLRKFAEKAKSKAEASGQAKTIAEPGLGAVYREGSSSTRLAVVFVFIFFGAALYFGGKFVVGMAKRASQAKILEAGGSVVSGGIAKQIERVHDDAAVVSLGHLATDTIQPNGKHAYLNVDIWVVCDSPETAKFMEDTGLRVHDLIINVFRAQAEQKLSPITDEGRERTRAEIIKAINKSLEHGKIIDVNFYNLVIE